MHDYDPKTVATLASQFPGTMERAAFLAGNQSLLTHQGAKKANVAHAHMAVHWAVALLDLANGKDRKVSDEK